MGKPRMIILIRHAQSEGNKNRDIHQTIPDHRVKLTPDGWTQAYDAGRRLRSLLRADDTLHFFTSPYRRTRETTEGILSTLTSDEPSPSPFRRHSIKVYEEPRLREQDFGNFQPCSAEMERMWQERADYGHFFYRIPNGESAADAYDRISGFNESLWRQFGEEDCASVCVLVTHGLMSRVFLMKWYHFSVEYFEDLRNVNHCEFLIMRKKEDSGKYILENKLRTWSELKREREAAREKDKDKEKDRDPTPKEKDKIEKLLSAPSAVQVTSTDSASSSSIIKKKQWGGCPDGCDHRRHYTRHTPPTSNGDTTNSPTSRRPAPQPWPQRTRRWQSSSEEDEDDPRGRAGPPKIAIQRSLDEVVSSPDGTPSYISMEDGLLRGRGGSRASEASEMEGVVKGGRRGLLKGGRDFGGSASGNTSQVGSDTDEEAVKGQGRGVVKGKRAPRAMKMVFGESGMGRGAKADALGDQSDVGSDAGGERDGEQEGGLEEAQKYEKSVEGSVY